MAKQRIMRKAIPTPQLDQIADAMAQVLGKNSAHRASMSHMGVPRMWVPSGVPELDKVLDRKGRGWPVGRIVEVYGAPATLKSALGYALIAQVQKMGGDGVIYPTEGEFDAWLAEKYGVDLKRLLLVEDEKNLTVEAVFSSYSKAIRHVARKGLLVSVIDSIAAMTTKAEMEEESFDRDRGAQIRALMISKAMRKLAPRIPTCNTILFCINQVRESTDHVPTKPKPPGGVALKFHASVRLRMEVVGKVYRQRKGVKRVGGFKLKVTAEKNRLAEPFQEAHIVLDFEKGLLPMPKKKKG